MPHTFPFSYKNISERKSLIYQVLSTFISAYLKQNTTIRNNSAAKQARLLSLRPTWQFKDNLAAYGYPFAAMFLV